MKNEVKVTFKNANITMNEVLRLYSLMEENFWAFLYECPENTKIETENSIFEITYNGIQATSKKRKTCMCISWIHILDIAN